jgi:pimeloyl-ACP methyl ester carboxylesterase
VTLHGRTLLGVALVLACACVAGCGGSDAADARRTGSFGQGADRFWIFARPDRDPRAVVVFLHGHGGPIEMTPTNHQPWLDHLAERGDTVVYPQYESTPGETGATAHIVRAAGRAWRLWDPSPCTPLVVVGYSRGGGLSVKYAASAPETGPVPDAVVSVFPGSSEEAPVDLRRLPPKLRIRVMVGDADEVVGSVGAIALLNGLRKSGFDPDRVEVVPVRSRPGFSATHAAVFETSPQARRELWARTDRLIEDVRDEKRRDRSDC